MEKREFTVADEYPYDRSGPVRWIASHAMRYPLFLLGTILSAILASAVGSQAPLYLGRTFDHVLSPTRNIRTLSVLSLAVVGFGLGRAALEAAHRVFGEFLSRRFQRDARDEFYVSLLGKSLSFHARQRTGDLMARATSDVRVLNYMFSPGLRASLQTLIELIVPVVAIASIHRALLLVPLALVIALAGAAWHSARQIKPVSTAQQQQLGQTQAGLIEALSGIKVVKASAQEAQQEKKFRADITRLRGLYIRYGDTQALYLPSLIQPAMFAVGFVYALALYTRGTLSLGSVVAFLGLLGQLRGPGPMIASLIARGLASAERILDIANAETELDENKSGVTQEMQGQVVFEDVCFGYDSHPVLKKISFCARPGETIAIVGQTGSGKTTLTRLIDRIYDATEGRVLVDGVDVRDWNLDGLRSQISSIEQDIFMFSRSIAENISFGAGRQVSQDEIERCAREAQAHDFITRFSEGYDTAVGERGVRLSGGQRQRIAIARAFLSDPRILILDDSTSAIDSATEDRIQSAMYKVRQGRTTFLITHRLSQIRWADRILVLRRGELVDQGTHEELMGRCAVYRRIYARDVKRET